VHSESEHVGREHGLEEEREQYSLCDLFGPTGTDRDEGSGKSTGGQKGDQKGEQEIAYQEKRDAAVARASVRP
jgi:hypothetical protein